MPCRGVVQQVVCQAVVWGLCGCNILILLKCFWVLVPGLLRRAADAVTERVFGCEVSLQLDAVSCQSAVFMDKNMVVKNFTGWKVVLHCGSYHRQGCLSGEG